MMSPDAGGTSLTRHCVVMAWFPHELTDVVMCCIPYSRVSEPVNKITLHSGTGQATSEPNRVCGADVGAAFEKMLDPIAGSPATGKSVVGIINLFADDLSEQVESKRNNVS